MSPVRRLRSRTWLFTGGLALAAALGVTTVLLDAQQPKYAPDLYSGLSWRMLGPFRGGRVDAVSGVPGRPNEFYFGAVNGGVWKTIDAGRVWTPVFDSQPVASIGALAVAPSSPDTVYVGSGESTLRDSIGYGNGMYKSTDAGKTWTHIGLDNTQHIGKVAVDPKNPNVVFVAAIGHLYEPHPDRGVFRTLDGGKTWTKVAVQERRRRRVRRRDRSDESAGRLCVAVEHAAADLVHLSADERPGRRDLQVHRRRHDVESAEDRVAARRASARSASAVAPSESAARLRGRRRLPAGRRAGGHAVPGSRRLGAALARVRRGRWRQRGGAARGA